MKNFIFKSTDADFKKMFSIIETIQKNVLYLTYRIDTLLKEVKSMTVDKDLQTQVDQYFENDPFGSAFNEANKTKDSDNGLATNSS